MGSISIQAWTLACAAIILLVSDALVAAFALVLGTTTGVQGQKEKKMEEPVKASGQTTARAGKKEL